jgi:membrane protease YdiL (CAAX protease family)
MKQPSSSAIALALLIPAPTIGVLFGMIIAPGTRIGLFIFSFSKVWILILPLLWHLFVDRQPLSLSPARHGGFFVGTALGLMIGLMIVAGYVFIGRKLIDPASFRAPLETTGLGSPRVYLAATAYWAFVNALLEEYVWRWFVVSRLRQLVPAGAAIAWSAAAFTLHHIFAMQVYLPLFVTAVASAGIFIGGVAWSWCYVRYRSVWPGYVSHAIVDLAVFAVGYHVLF